MKEFARDLKEVYTSVTEEAAMERLIAFKEKWGAKYPAAIKSWEDNWDMVLNHLIILFEDRYAI